MSGPCVVLGGSQPGIYNVRPRGLAEKHWPYLFPIIIHCNNQTEVEKLYHIQEKHFKSAMTDDPPAHIVMQIVENLHDSWALGIIEGLLDVKSFM
ncbi:hypothetical protein WOLCODRAFT_167788 [Wolfiporia cocos MD-104 SS10]|uniref:Uncharacterized protein n=1 Tax=Wolfiporia cocos (strain MD-104) TaxID=742152 RepID=A0A2H3JMU3_WOLCO|nr:hypothetical protein WOLCODRAFT_167788 [Wolfiporia cocos MD-104 SS10]